MFPVFLLGIVCVQAKLQCHKEDWDEDGIAENCEPCGALLYSENWDTCDEFCEDKDMTCISAADEVLDTCDVKLEWDCNTSAFEEDTPDYVCFCSGKNYTIDNSTHIPKHSTSAWCDFVLFGKYPVVINGITVILFISGALCCFAGFKLYQFVIFYMGALIGFVAGAFLTIEILVAVGSRDKEWAVWCVITVGLAFGAACGLFATRSQERLGYCFPGIMVGICLGQIIDGVLDSFVAVYSPNAVWVWVLVLGIVFGIVGFHMGKVFVMIATALYGSTQLWFGLSAVFIVVGNEYEDDSFCNPGDHLVVAGSVMGILILTHVGYFVQRTSSKEEDKYAPLPNDYAKVLEMS